MQSIKPTMKYETKCKEDGYFYIAGIDEVGRGPWAGPVVAGAVILTKNIKGLKDSKILTEKRGMN